MKTYFNFTRKQKIGVVSLSCIILLLVVLLNVNYHRELPDPTDIELSEISFININSDSSNSLNGVNYSYANDNQKIDYELFIFNPNSLDRSGWEDLGFTQKQAESIVNYRSNYGPFTKATDLKKLYVISDKKYEELEPYIVFENTAPAESKMELIIDVNTATQEELESIRGIGPTFAKRTINYREVLGGYVSKDQFSEIYGITKESLEALTAGTVVDLEQVDKIAINTESKENIKKHPYFKDWPLVTAIIEERDKRKISDLRFLIEKGILNQTEVDKLTPYLDFER